MRVSVFAVLLLLAQCAHGANLKRDASSVPSTPSPSPIMPASTNPSKQCSAHPACSALSGDCCPTPHNAFLDCCTLVATSGGNETSIKEPTKKPSNAPMDKPTSNLKQNASSEPSALPPSPIMPSPTNPSPTNPSPTNPSPETPTLVSTSGGNETPTTEPAKKPSKAPTNQSTSAPKTAPTNPSPESPSALATIVDSEAPTKEPTKKPTQTPMRNPTSAPTEKQTKKPTSVPTAKPTESPTYLRTSSPSLSNSPSETPSSSASPTEVPTTSIAPSSKPSGQPSIKSSLEPSGEPSFQPSTSLSPSTKPSFVPTAAPSGSPSERPSIKPSLEPSGEPSLQPSTSPSPSTEPSFVATAAPSGSPSERPSTKPSLEPSGEPSLQPSTSPSPSTEPSFVPTAAPSGSPSKRPSTRPSVEPSQSPSGEPSAVQSGSPTVDPSDAPSQAPSGTPSGYPSSFPTYIKVISTSLSVSVRAGSLMDGPTIAVFETTTMDFLNEYLPADDTISITAVNVTNQVLEQRRVLSQKKDRALQVANRLKVDVDVFALWHATDSVGSYPPQKKIERTLHENYPVYESDLVEASSFFRDGFQAEKATDAGANLSTVPVLSDSTLIIIGVVTGCALLAIFVGLFVWRRQGRAKSPDPNLVLPSWSSQEISAATGYLSSGDGNSPTNSEVYSDDRQASKRSLVPKKSNSNLSQVSERDDSSSVGSVPGPTYKVDDISIDTSVSSSDRYARPPPVPPYSPFAALSTIDENSQIMREINRSTPRGRATPSGGMTPRSSEFVQVNRFPALSLDGLHQEQNSPATPKYAYNSPLTPKHAKFEDCYARSPKTEFVSGQETPKGTQFMQLNTSSAVKTGGILDDLTRFERAWDVQLNSKVNAITDTPKANNLERFKKAPKKVLYGINAGK